ncbi:MAG TPA: thioredoxin domain-containing protein [Woeseiaceae bacterium]|nr:thioredoxin domain-containing protein [Woeseiaceae bacterium]
MADDRSRPFELVPPVGAADHVRGPREAPVTVVEYGDFECPNCKQAASALDLLLARFEGSVCLVYRHFPLEGVHPHALQAAEAAECAAAQGAFWEMHDLLFENQLHLEPEHLRGYAATLGLDLAPFDEAMRAHAWNSRVRKHIESGERSGVRSTPGIFVNGRIQDVSFGLQSLFDATAALLRKA